MQKKKRFACFNWPNRDMNLFLDSNQNPNYSRKRLVRILRKGNLGKIKSLIKCSDRQDYNHERREKKKESIKQVSRSSEMKMKTRKKKKHSPQYRIIIIEKKSKLNS